ncbi:glucosaminidase domain-containing protein [Roseburia hominis]
MEKNGTKASFFAMLLGEEQEQERKADQEVSGKKRRGSAGGEERKADTESTEEMALTEEQKKEIEAVEASIVPGQYPIMGASSITRQQMVDYFKESGEAYPAEILGQGGAADIETFCQIYYEEAVKEGVRPEVAFAQTMKETGWLQYGGDAKIEQYNFAGLGTTGGGVPGNSYPDVRTGVRAQIQHLKAYATDTALEGECVDDRYQYVAKGSAPYVEWLGQKENPKGCGWATGENYGYDIVEMIRDMRR